MIIPITCAVAIVVIVFVLGVRPKDIPPPEPVLPFLHLDERKASIYENLRDLQFEYRVGKLSDDDYQATKKELQKDLAKVLAEVDRIKSGAAPAAAVAMTAAAPAAAPSVPAAIGLVCPHCGAKFEKALKFCGECGKPMQAVAQ
jgi:hypothetical protein